MPLFETRLLLDWYEENKRSLPWRGEKDPYKIWVSEIILQQTRVAQGWDYYLNFIAKFPTVQALAEAPQEEVMKVWQGLGYYSRARNMHETARNITRNFNGQFPGSHSALLKLKGIGDYTAAAIASIAFGLPFPAVDGNVFRVITRLYGIFDDISRPATRKYITAKCEKLIDRNHPGEFNQAMMEFGATRCTPKNPDCEHCPFQNRCYAYSHEVIDRLPVKVKSIVLKNRYLHYFFFHTDEETLIQQRVGNDIWKNLYELPLMETGSGKIEREEVHNTFPIRNDCLPEPLLPQLTLKHQLSHQTIHACFYMIETNPLPEAGKGQLKIKISEIEHYPVSRLVAKFLETIR